MCVSKMENGKFSVKTVCALIFPLTIHILLQISRPGAWGATTLLLTTTELSNQVLWPIYREATHVRERVDAQRLRHATPRATA